MLVGGVIKWKGKFTANSNQALRDVCTGYGTKVPCIEKEEDSIGHYCQAFCEVLINTLNHHGVTGITRKDVAVDVQ